MNIIHHQINEYDTAEELYESYFNSPKEKYGKKIVSCKRQAEKEIKTQWEKHKTKGARIFWVEKAVFNRVVTYILNETLID